MSFLKHLNPFRKTVENLTGTLDTWVEERTLDKDLALQIKAGIEHSEIEVQKLGIQLESKEIELRQALAQSKETSYQMELQTKTNVWLDAWHKMGRQRLAFLNLVFPFVTIIWLAYLGIEVTEKHMIMMGMGSTASGIYNWRKGKGREFK